METQLRCQASLKLFKCVAFQHEPSDDLAQIKAVEALEFKNIHKYAGMIAREKYTWTLQAEKVQSRHVSQSIGSH